MKRYRIFSLDPMGRLFHTFHLACSDDLQAITEGKSISAASHVEIWDDERLVVRLEPGDSSIKPENIRTYAH